MKKKPDFCWAFQWDGTAECGQLILDWVKEYGREAEAHPHEDLIVLGDNVAPAKPGDWVIRDKFGDFWPLPNDTFLGVYESLFPQATL